MHPIKNQFSPGAGPPPPELVGRASVLQQAPILLGHVLAGHSEISLLRTASAALPERRNWLELTLTSF